jgi:hypothetical protein
VLRFAALATVLDELLMRMPTPRGPTRRALHALILAAAAIGPAGLARADDAATLAITGAGFENVSASGAGDSLRIGYENRRYRHPAEAMGHLARGRDATPRFLERRFGLEAARVQLLPARPAGWIERFAGGAGDASFQVRYPSDDPWWLSEPGPWARPTTRTLDLEIGPRVTYEFGRVLEPFVWSLDLEPRLRFSPWTGARFTASALIPLHNDFERTELQPDLGRFRPGVVSAEQYFWVPGVALGSANVGVFDRNRYGASVGLARPLSGGTWLLDGQADLTGFVSFTEGEIRYSSMSLWTGFTGLTWRTPVYDLSLRTRAQWFLFGDRGVEFQVRREIGDLGVAFYRQWIDGDDVDGVRIDIPIPPMVRRAPAPVRVQPVTRFPFSYDDRGRAIGSAITGVASREALLDALHPGALNANRRRFENARAGLPGRAAPRDAAWVSLSGMSGFATTPWAGTIGDRNLEVGYSHVPKRWAYDNRGVHANAYYFGTIGFLPFAEVQLRWSQIVGRRDFEAIVPDSRLADLDRTASLRVALLEPRPGRPGLAVGIDDLVGTRRFHSTYAVAGMPGRILGMQGRAAIGYAPRAFEAPRHILDGAFGALEWQPWRILRVHAEYDSEKWNAGLGFEPGFGIRLRVAALDLESLSAGAGWSWPL